MKGYLIKVMMEIAQARVIVCMTMLLFVFISGYSNFFVFAESLPLERVSSPAIKTELPRKTLTRLGLDETVTRALATNEGLKIKDSEVVKARQVYNEARSGLLPHITAQSVWTNNRDYPSSDSTKTEYALSGGIAVSQLLWSFGKVSSAVSSAKRAAEASWYSREAGKNDIVYAAKLNYYSVLLARDSLFIAEESYNNAQENKKLLEKRSNGGRSSKFEILKMSADVSSRVPTVNEVRAQYEAALETLKSLIEAQPSEEFEFTDGFKPDYDELDYEVLEKALLVHEPSLKSLDKIFEASQAAVNNRRAGFFPTLSAFASLDKIGGSDQDTVPSNSNLDKYAAVGLKISVPLWEGGQKEALLGQAISERTTAQLKKEQARKALVLELKKAYVEYRQYKDNLIANIEAVRLAGESFKQMQEMFTSGQVTLTDLNDAELLLTNQRLNKEMTLFNINITLAKIEKLIAGEYDERNAGKTDKK
ncbi:MAG: TolC family protein, partial [Candidatus Omnitrophica bacterium]|nr:TolC family protein [Candidatus Omnitrophota bacterium]